MKTRYILYSKKMDSEELRKFAEQLRAGVDIEACGEDSNGLLMLCVTGRKKKGRPNNTNINVMHVLKQRDEGASVKQLAAQYGCSPSYIYNLINKARKEGPNYGI